MRRRRKNSWNLSPEFKERFKKEKFIRAHRIRISGIGTTCRKPNPKVCLEKVTRRRSKKFERASLYYRLYMGVRADRDISAGWTRMKSRWHGQVGPRLLPEQLRNRWIILSRDVRINLRHVKSVPRGYIYIYIYMDEIARIMNRARWMVQAVVCGFHVGRDAFDLFC